MKLFYKIGKLIAQPFFDFMERWQKHKIAFMLLFTISVFIGFNAPSVNYNFSSEGMFNYVIVLLASSVLMYLREKGIHPFNWFFIDSFIIIFFFALVAITLLIQFTFSIRALSQISDLSIQSLLSIAFFLAPFVITLLSRTKR